MEPPQINLDILPPETITKILLGLNLADLLNFCKTSHTAMEYCKSDQFWKDKYKHDFKHLPSIGNMSWKEQYKLVYTVPNSPVSAGFGHFVIIDDQNMLYMGGNYKYKNGFNYKSDFGKLSRISPFKQRVRSVFCGDYFTSAVTEDGRVYLWGKRLNQTIFDTNEYIREPREFKIPGRAIKIVCGPRRKKIHAGPMFAVILEDRSVFIRMYFLFIGPETSYSIIGKKRKISTTLNIKALDISTHGEGLAIVSTDGKLYYLGRGLGSRYIDNVGVIFKDGQIVIDPVHIPLPEAIKQVSLAYHHIGVLSTSGNIYLWGDNKYGQLGQDWKTSEEPDIYAGGEIDYYFDRPLKLSFPVPISFIACQDQTTAAIDKNGKLYRWGMNRGSIDRKQNDEFLEFDGVILGIEDFDRWGNEKYRDWVAITRPIHVEIKLSEDVTTIKNKFNYVAIGRKMAISTTTDGWVNVWNEHG